MDIVNYVMKRYTTKAFDPSKKISKEDAEKIETLLRYSPSSTNSQPWHFFIASTEEGKNTVAKATAGRSVFNEAKIKNASHVVVFCTKATIDEAYLKTLLDQEATDGRFANDEGKINQHNGRSYFVNAHRFELRDSQHWMEKQVYLSVGTLLLGASVMGIDACPIEGFDQKIMDEVLNLREKGLTSSVIVALGYRAENDFNAKLPKSRLPSSSTITHL